MTRHVLDSDPPVWTLVNEVDTATVKRNEEMSKDPLELVCCALCRHKAYRPQIVSHLLNESVIPSLSPGYSWLTHISQARGPRHVRPQFISPSGRTISGPQDPFVVWLMDNGLYSVWKMLYDAVPAITLCLVERWGPRNSGCGVEILLLHPVRGT
jgi:hypothetical protein